MANNLPSLLGSVPVSKWGQKINKHCTSDYWAEDKSAWFDRSLLPASLPPFTPPPLLFFSLLLLHPRLTCFLSFFFPSVLPLTPSLPPSLHLFLLHPSLTLIPQTHSLPFWPSPAVPPYPPLLSPAPILLYFNCGASKYVGLKSWESIDLGRELAKFKRPLNIRKKAWPSLFSHPHFSV